MRRMILLALAGGLCTWAALPPLALWPLGWIAPLPWLLIAREPALPGRRPYRVLYLCGLAYWILQLQWIRLPHWSTGIGGLALAAYLAVYFPALVVLVRVLMRRFRIPFVLAAPLVYTALEYGRGFLFTGFSLALLAHSQSEQLIVIQIADLGGAYAVTFLMVLVAAAITAAIPWPSRPTYWPLAVAVAAVLAALGYGSFRLREQLPADDRVLRVAIIQGSLDTIFGDTPEHIQEAYDDYHARAVAVARAHPELDVIVWPESMFTGPYPSYSIAEPYAPPSQVLPERREEFKRWLDERVAEDAARRETLAGAVNAPDDYAATRHAQLIVGAEVIHFTPQGVERYNSATLIGPRGELVERYEKMHPVMFGEYVPLGDVFPWLYSLTPMGEGLTAGKRAHAFEVSGFRLSPSVCFESTVPHLIRSQVATLRAEDKTPDVLVNVTNDGWFWGSSLLDLHLRCGVFRAVETRKPMLIAANTGFSAVIDGNGRIVEKGPRRERGEIVADVRADGRESPYLTLGDWPWMACLALCAIAAVIDWRALRKK